MLYLMSAEGLMILFKLCKIIIIIILFFYFLSQSYAWRPYSGSKKDGPKPKLNMYSHLCFG